MKNSGALESAILAVGWNAENHEKKNLAAKKFAFPSEEGKGRHYINEILDIAFEF
jgi:hypothetical protein